MGVIYKLQPKIKEFILEKKQKEPRLSCRQLAIITAEKFQIKLSKSSVNSLIKEAKLSMPVGRRRRKARKGQLEEARNLGTIFLKAANFLICGKELESATNLEELGPVPNFQEVRWVRVILADGGFFYLDGQLHTIWSTPYTPYDFSTTIYNIRGYVNKYLQEDAPFVFFMAPGYDIPTKEFFSFLLSLDRPDKREISQLVLYGNRFEEIEIIRPLTMNRRFFVFGLWPWQFSSYRQIKTAPADFKPFYFEPLQKDLYLAEIGLELSQPTTNERVTLRGCAVKTSLNDKIKLLILTNFSAQETTQEALANMYLSHWPNLDEAFQDYSRKIELFTYTANSQRFFSTENLSGKYLEALDSYVKWHFLPSGYEDKDFSVMKERFYGLSGRIKKQKDYFLITLTPPSGYPFLKDLEYACHRVNEREIVFSEGKRLWCSV